MKLSRPVAVAVLATVALTATGCAKRQIDPDATGSVAVAGTGGEHALQKFCDGPTLIYWTPGRSGEEDEYEFIVYESSACTDDGDPATVPAGVDVGQEPAAEPIPDEED